MKNTSVLITGVGGQGTLFASKVFGQLALNMGFDVKLSEVHGMAQRGGSVVTHVRFGEKIASPIIDKGGADIILSFELMEAMRWLDYLKKDGKAYVNEHKILPLPVITGAAEYPDDLKEAITAQAGSAVFVDALSLALEAGSAKSVNTVMLGVLAKSLPEIPEEEWEKAIGQVCKPAFVEMNLTAFKKGYQAV